MKITYFFPLVFSSLLACTSAPDAPQRTNAAPVAAAERKVSDIPLPAGFRREAETGFARFLNQVTLREDKTVYLYNGRPKTNQQAQYAVLDISVGQKDLQQCADAVMRLRAEYLFSQKRYRDIAFTAGDGTVLNYAEWLRGQRYRLNRNRLVAYRMAVVVAGRHSLNQYLEFVFSYCSTASLTASLRKKTIGAIRAGDVFLKPGAPGHAVIVLATASNQQGQIRYLLAQSYMPAQDIHVLNNPEAAMSPWYEVRAGTAITTPEWTFDANQLYGWRLF